MRRGGNDRDLGKLQYRSHTRPDTAQTRFTIKDGKSSSPVSLRRAPIFRGSQCLSRHTLSQNHSMITSAPLANAQLPFPTPRRVSSDSLPSGATMLQYLDPESLTAPHRG